MRYSQNDIQTGWTVYDSTGEKIGSVNELFNERFVMNTGLFGLGTQYGIPYSAISKLEGDGIYLNTSRERLSDFTWDKEKSEPTLSGTRGGETHFDDRERGFKEKGRDLEHGLREKKHDLEHGERTIPLREEELEVRRRSEQAGEVTISKDVEEERRRMNVPVSEERVYVERRPASGREASGSIGDDETISVPIHEEEVDVSKRTVVREDLVIGKEDVTRNKEVDETLRREVPRVDKEGDVRELSRDKDRSKRLEDDKDLLDRERKFRDKR
ncbi:MAG: YsnF/AvaK domain-containing protein [Chloroflexota bacterium]